MLPLSVWQGPLSCIVQFLLYEKQEGKTHTHWVLVISCVCMLIRVNSSSPDGHQPAAAAVVCLSVVCFSFLRREKTGESSAVADSLSRILFFAAASLERALEKEEEFCWRHSHYEWRRQAAWKKNSCTTSTVYLFEIVVVAFEVVVIVLIWRVCGPRTRSARSVVMWCWWTDCWLWRQQNNTQTCKFIYLVFSQFLSPVCDIKSAHTSGHYKKNSLMSFRFPILASIIIVNAKDWGLFLHLEL